MPPAAQHQTAVTYGTVAFLCGLAETEELPGTFLVEVLTALGMSGSGARSHLRRAVGDGRLATRRVGRRTFYRLSGVYLQQYQQVESRFSEPPAWEGHFHIVIYDVPETRRAERDALRAAAFEKGWASPRPGVLLGMGPPGAWAADPSCSAGRLEIDDVAARTLAARAWPLAEAAMRIRHLAAELEEMGQAQPHEQSTRDDAHAVLLERIVDAHTLLRRATYLWGSLPHLPAELLPEDYPHDLLARITDTMNGPIMGAGVRAAHRLLAEHQ
ncbi:PaaX-like protein C-terminal domain protein [Actinomyces slackii]|uniref:Phenylacetic acid-responsive transcriptional repressor n=1 Tax=Actinomyces slackii TaxID=52774 RepID=A0A3S4SKU6_9ACTO|nr:PaaX-like protein C-terminal domain protein [Actinomyces slackii]VEG75048.1 Phenylacetic acid-responsive transcriptional repressor [Actinomyces slackii]